MSLNEFTDMQWERFVLQEVVRNQRAKNAKQYKKRDSTNLLHNIKSIESINYKWEKEKLRAHNSLSIHHKQHVRADDFGVKRKA